MVAVGAVLSVPIGIVGGGYHDVLDVTATPDNTRVTLTWLASSGATGYNVGYSLTNGGPYTSLAGNLAGTSFTGTGLTNGTTYYFIVTAENSAGGNDSAQVIATPGTLDRLLWVATSSTMGGDAPGNALDGDLTTRWSTDTSQVSGQWFEVDMGSTSTFNKIVLNSINSPSDYPRDYQVNISNDNLNWGSPVATGVGTPTSTTISFATQAARYVRVTQTGSVQGLFWSIDEFNVFGTVPLVPANLTAAPFSSTEISLSWPASVSASGYNVKRAAVSGGSYTTVAPNVSGLAYTDTGLTPGTTYYYVVTATNSFGESGKSVPASAETVSTTPPQITRVLGGGQLQLSWPADHTGWRLEAQTNAVNGGLGTIWVTVANSTTTNLMNLSINATNGSVFYRLVYP